MSSAATTANVATPAGAARSQVIRPEPEGLFMRQISGILRLELKKSLLSRRAFGLYFLAALPLFPMVLWVLVTWTGIQEAPSENMTQMEPIIAILFRLYLRVSIYLSCLLMFMSLFRNEVLERSLHYYFLTPVRRDVLMAGKYLSALFAAWIAFFIGTVAFYVLALLPWGIDEFLRYFFQGPGLGHLVAYVATALLGVAGYGAVFMLMGQYFKNPVVPGLLVFAWEAVNPVLPATLKKVSVIFYLQSFYPVPPPEDAGPFSLIRVLADPPPAWVSIFGLVIFTGLVIVAAGWRSRRMEVAYGDD